MTREKAVSVLRRYRRTVFEFHENGVIFSTRNALFKQCVYGRYLVDEVIRRIKESNDDPILVVDRLYGFFDAVLGDSDEDHFETHSFAALMEYTTGDILRYLRTIAKEENEDGEN